MTVDGEQLPALEASVTAAEEVAEPDELLEVLLAAPLDSLLDGPLDDVDAPWLPGLFRFCPGRSIAQLTLGLAAFKSSTEHPNC